MHIFARECCCCFFLERESERKRLLSLSAVVATNSREREIVLKPQQSTFSRERVRESIVGGCSDREREGERVVSRLIQGREQERQCRNHNNQLFSRLRERARVRERERCCCRERGRESVVAASNSREGARERERRNHNNQLFSREREREGEGGRERCCWLFREREGRSRRDKFER